MIHPSMTYPLDSACFSPERHRLCVCAIYVLHFKSLTRTSLMRSVPPCELRSCAPQPRPYLQHVSDVRDIDRNLVCHTLPQILSGVLLVVNFLFDQLLVLWVVWIHNHDGLPPSTSLAGVADLEHGCENQHCKSETLSVNSGLNKLLCASQVWVSPNQLQRNSHRCNPRNANNWVSVLASPSHELLESGIICTSELLVTAGVVLVEVLLVAGLLEAAGGLVGHEDTDECGRGCDEESLHWQGEVADDWKAAVGERNSSESNEQTDTKTSSSSLEGGIIMRLLLFFRENLHDVCGVRRRKVLSGSSIVRCIVEMKERPVVYD